jgi:hypothetical protein
VPVYFLLFPSIDPHPSKTLAEKLRLVDWVNAVIFLAGSTCLTLALTFGGVIYPFNSGVVIALWAVTGVLLIAFIVMLKLHPLVTKENRLYPLHFFKQPILINMQLQVFLSSGIILVGQSLNSIGMIADRYMQGYDLLHTPIFPIRQGTLMNRLQFLYTDINQGDGALEAGVRLLPLIMFMVVASMVNGFLMPRYGLIPVWYIGGSTLALIGTALMCKAFHFLRLRRSNAPAHVFHRHCRC